VAYPRPKKWKVSSTQCCQNGDTCIHIKIINYPMELCKGVSKSFRTGRVGRELQMVQLSATRCSCIAILWASLVSFAAITICTASQWVFIVVSVYFVIDSVRKLLGIASYILLINTNTILRLCLKTSDDEYKETNTQSTPCIKTFAQYLQKCSITVKLKSLCCTMHHTMKTYWRWRYSATHSWPRH
jgi:hypothetical protein